MSKIFKNLLTSLFLPNYYYFLAILGFSIIGIIFLYFMKKDILMELPPFILPNTGNMGLPICLFAYGSQGLGVAGAISSLIILLHLHE